MATSEKMTQSMINNLPAKTGKPLAEWLVLVACTGVQKHGQIVTYLKDEHGMTHGYANLVAHNALKKNEPVDLVSVQYAGAKANLKPIHDTIVEIANGFGSDVEIAPKKTCVSMRRNKQFAVITPATKTRIDLGLNLKGNPGDERLKATPGAMCTHKLGITNSAQIDTQLQAWLRAAYDAC